MASWNWDGSVYAYGQSDKGSDWQTIKFRNVDGTERPEIVEKVKFSGISWMRDSSGIFYSAFQERGNQSKSPAFLFSEDKVTRKS